MSPDSFLHVMRAISRNTASKFDKVKLFHRVERKFFLSLSSSKSVWSCSIAELQFRLYNHAYVHAQLIYDYL